MTRARKNAYISRFVVMSPPVLAFLWLCVAMTIILAFTLASTAVGFILLTCGLVVLIVATAFSAIRVYIADDGLHAKSLLGFPSVQVSPSEIDFVTVRPVRALREYGGWGLRIRMDNDLGFIMRSGSALVVHKRGGARLTITLPNPELFARVLQDDFDVMYGDES